MLEIPLFVKYGESSENSALFYSARMNFKSWEAKKYLEYLLSFLSEFEGNPGPKRYSSIGKVVKSSAQLSPVLECVPCNVDEGLPYSNVSEKNSARTV